MLTRPQKAGHVLGILLALIDFVPSGSLSGKDAHGDISGPPLPVVVLSWAIGVAVLVLLVWSWRSGQRGPRRTAAVLIALSALTALPAFGQATVSESLKLVVGIAILLSATAIVLLFYPRRAA